MRNLGVKVALFSSYFLFAILLNSVGTVILQSISSFGVSKESASVLEAFKDLPIAVVSFLIASFLPRIGYRRALMAAFATVAIACLIMPLMPSFTSTKILFFSVGVSFALVKVSVYSTIGLITRNSNHHASLLNTLEGFFMIGVLVQGFIFAAFINSADPSSLNWLNVYWVLSGLAAANVLLLMFVSYPTAVIADQAQSLGRDFGDMVALIARPIVLVFLMSAFLFVLIEQGIGTWLPTFNNEALHLPAAMSVQVATIFAGASALGRFGAGAILQKVDWYWFLNACIIGMAALIILALPTRQRPEARPRYDLVLSSHRCLCHSANWPLPCSDLSGDKFCYSKLFAKRLSRCDGWVDRRFFSARWYNRLHANRAHLWRI